MKVSTKDEKKFLACLVRIVTHLIWQALLAAGADVNHPANNGGTSLSWAAHNGHVEVDSDTKPLRFALLVTRN